MENMQKKMQIVGNTPEGVSRHPLGCCPYFYLLDSNSQKQKESLLVIQSHYS
jgi:hypothetical protein